jgi:hypothetical protein
VRNDGKGRAGGGGGPQIEEEEGVGARVGADGYSFDQGHFEQWSTCWRYGLVYLCRLYQLGRQQLSFLYWLLTLTRGPYTIFSELKLASLKY